MSARSVDVAAAGELTAEERQALLRVARESIAAHFQRRRPQLPAATGALAENRGAFVTLHRRDGELRGCVGMMQSDRPLLDTVARMAVASATEDGRFEPVTEAELGGLKIEISALGPLAPIRPEQVEVGRHGLLISSAGRRGVLLPQVPVEHGWDREAFLAHTCRKAGLPADTWRKPGVELLGFTAAVFSEHS
ncbi:MAG TPA: AmmeMemoRadiSam system protein A [Vicinamibacteria bacterium]|nr:AmmeMemoRadiSam system protein A [Vicinamibacteria bacterium]